jgi:hypothetical protein
VLLVLIAKYSCAQVMIECSTCTPFFLVLHQKDCCFFWEQIFVIFDHNFSFCSLWVVQRWKLICSFWLSSFYLHVFTDVDIIGDFQYF